MRNKFKPRIEAGTGGIPRAIMHFLKTGVNGSLKCAETFIAWGNNKEKKETRGNKEGEGGTQTDTGYPVFPVHHTHVLGKLIHV